MSTYAIGDIQGCYSSFMALLKKIEFNPDKDTLWVAGDMINRGPDSLATLRFLYEHRASVIAVLGNHDLHFLAIAYGYKKPGKYDTLSKLLNAEDRPTLINWLRQCRLIHHDAKLDYTMVHAGIPPIWSISEALRYSQEVETLLQSNDIDIFLQHMYGNEPRQWSDALEGAERHRVITNYLTRMRYCRADGTLDFDNKSTPSGDYHDYNICDYIPWYKHKTHKSLNKKIIFGHWAALKGETGVGNTIALDTGCVWGGKLTAFRLEDGTYFNVQ